MPAQPRCHAHTANTVDVEPEARFVPGQQLPESALQFLLPSRYCQSDLLNELASSVPGQAPLIDDPIETLRE